MLFPALPTLLQADRAVGQSLRVFCFHPAAGTGMGDAICPIHLMDAVCAVPPPGGWREQGEVAAASCSPRDLLVKVVNWGRGLTADTRCGSSAPV